MFCSWALSTLASQRSQLSLRDDAQARLAHPLQTLCDAKLQLFSEISKSFFIKKEASPERGLPEREKPRISQIMRIFLLNKN